MSDRRPDEPTPGEDPASSAELAEPSGSKLAESSSSGAAAVAVPGTIALLAALSMFGPFSIDTVFPAFAVMGRELGADTLAMQQVTSVYLLAFGAMSLFHGPLSDAVGRKPVMIVGILAYVLASIGCALSTSLPMLLAFRALQGATAGAGQIVARAVVRDLYSGPRAQAAMSQIIMIFAVAPALAPIVGGWILAFGPWPWIFWFLAAFGLAMAALTASRLPETHPPQARTPLRVGPLLAGLWEVGRQPTFLRIAMAGSLAFAGQFLYIAAAPIFVLDLLDLGEQDFWIFFVPTIGCMVLGAHLTGRAAGKIEPGRLASFGLAIALFAGVLNVTLQAIPGLPPLPWAVVGPALMAFGIAMVFPVLQVAMLDLFPHRRGAASSVGAFLTLMLNAALSGAVAPFVTDTRLHLAIASLVLVLLGWGLWRWHQRAAGLAGPADPVAP